MTAMAAKGASSGKQVGIWIRVSADMQVDDESPQRHEERARAYALGKGWNVVEVYRLDAVSGKSVMGHATTVKMLQDVRAGRISALVFSKLARLARNTRELLEFAVEFEKCGADLVSLEECIDTSSPAGRVFFTMIAAMAQWEREEISSRVAASVPERAKMGRSTGGKPIYGYHWVENKLVPHPEEAAVRKLMYELFLEHRRKLTVSRILNERGYRTRAGNLWSYSSVGKLLQDPTAKGIRLANFTRNCGNGQWEFKPQDEWVKVPVEAIVSEEQWNECNRILGEVREGHGRFMQKGRNPKYLFSGLVFCGACGHDVKMYPQTGTSKYRCFKCTNKIPKDDLEALFIEQMSDFLLDDRRIAEYLGKASEAADEKRSLLDSLAKESDKISKRLESLVDLYQGGAVGLEEFKRQSVPLETRKVEIGAETVRLGDQLVVLDAEQVSSATLAKDGAKLVGQWFKMSHEKKRELVENLLSRVTVDRSEIDFELKYLPGAGKKQPHSHLFNYAKGHNAEWLDPNEELIPK